MREGVDVNSTSAVTVKGWNVDVCQEDVEHRIIEEKSEQWIPSGDVNMWWLGCYKFGFTENEDNVNISYNLYAYKASMIAIHHCEFHLQIPAAKIRVLVSF